MIHFLEYHQIIICCLLWVEGYQRLNYDVNNRFIGRVNVKIEPLSFEFELVPFLRYPLPGALIYDEPREGRYKANRTQA